MERIFANHKLLIEALNHTRAGIIITDPNQDDNPIIYANQGFFEMTGYEQNEIIGQNCRFLQGKDTDSNEVDVLRQAIHQKKSVTVELLNYRKDGKSFWNNLSVDCLHMDYEDKTYFIGVQKDVTYRREVEESYERSLQEIKSLACPIVPLLKDIAVLPLIGEMNEHRFNSIFDISTKEVVHQKITTLIVDLSGLTTFNDLVLRDLIKLRDVLKLLGAELILSGVSSKMAAKAIELDGMLASDIRTANSVRSLLAELM
ncbi:YtvA family blue-light photoreceptor [Alkalicoccobacillus murimartini]|uniref:PAS domain S-box-containing protein n=1 Tax=Alkalicoccobacillus murimartini TaxID=171685 RepID=A0ABT9YGR8_9BACI|nr:PAS domain-containing protein [Alkalicoccobacillus murimartini]MDQ0206249.1 PAS domain S-box-containing protein [Alkalicoccobacillus murimartini]